LGAFGKPQDPRLHLIAGDVGMPTRWIAETLEDPPVSELPLSASACALTADGWLSVALQRLAVMV